MDDIRIGSGISNSSNILDSKGNQPKKLNNQSNSFEDLLNDAMGKIDEIQKDAEQAVRELARGGDVTQAIISLEKADMSFQMMVEIRNRLLNAYEEIMRMQV